MVGFDRSCPRLYPDGTAHEWTLDYDPAGASGRGTLTISVDGKAKTLELSDGARAIRTDLDRFGFVSTWIDGNGQTVYLDDLSYTAGPE
jgi:hypothetical protein